MNISNFTFMNTPQEPMILASDCLKLYSDLINQTIYLKIALGILIIAITLLLIRINKK